MIQVTGNYFVTHNALLPTEHVNSYVRDVNRTVYEVLRVVHYTPLFLEDHIQRFTNSFTALQKADSAIVNTRMISERLHTLIAKNNISDGNIRFQFNNNNPSQFCAWYIPSSYPTVQQYSEGVTVKTLQAERSDPNIKARDKKLRIGADLFIRKEKISEAILVNNEGFLTEGSRSNIFFIRNQTFVTPPLSCVLPGITRQKVIRLIKTNELDFQETALHKDTLDKYQACFITGTSVKILPVARIDNVSTDVTNHLLRKIMKLYNLLISNYLNDFRWPEE